MELLQFDVKMSFLHRDLEEEVSLVTRGLWGTNEACRLVCWFTHNTKLGAKDDIHWANPSSLLVVLGFFFLLCNKLVCCSTSSSGRIFSTPGSFIYSLQVACFPLLALNNFHKLYALLQPQLWQIYISWICESSWNCGRKSHWFKYNILYTDQNAILHIHSIACILYKSILTVYTTTTHRTRAEEDSTRRATENQAEELLKILPGELKKIQILPEELQKIKILPEELKNILPGELLRSATRSMEDSTRTAEVELQILFRGWVQQAGQWSEEPTDVQML